MNPTKIDWMVNVALAHDLPKSRARAWQIVTGCKPISKGCANCWARGMVKDFTPTAHKDRLEEPGKTTLPCIVLVAPMGDLLIDEISDSFLVRVWLAMANAKQHLFLVLTKRTERLRRLLKDGRFPVLHNVWLGTSIEALRSLQLRLPQLVKTPAAVRFSSIEPLLGSLVPRAEQEIGIKDYTHAREVVHDNQTPPLGLFTPTEPVVTRPPIGWWILGGESGSDARPMHPDWVREVRDRCQQINALFYFKQWGEWVSAYAEHGSLNENVRRSGAISKRIYHNERAVEVYRVGKKRAGHLLDGREHRDIPIYQRP
jgi:protein gp37